MRVRAAAGVPGRPTAVAAGGRIVDCCPRAAGAGVEPGMAVRQARRLCPPLRVTAVADDDRRLAALAEILHQALYDLTPVVEPDPPTTAFAAVTLTPRYSQDDLRSDLRRLAQRVCPAAADALTAGVAGSRFAARLAAAAASGVRGGRGAGGARRRGGLAGAPAGGSALAPAGCGSPPPAGPGPGDAGRRGPGRPAGPGGRTGRPGHRRRRTGPGDRPLGGNAALPAVPGGGL